MQSEQRTYLEELQDYEAHVERFEHLTRQALRSLTPKQREVVEDVYFGGKTLRECAQAHGVNPYAVQTRIMAAWKKLAKPLEEFPGSLNQPRSPLELLGEEYVEDGEATGYSIVKDLTSLPE